MTDSTQELSLRLTPLCAVEQVQKRLKKAMLSENDARNAQRLAMQNLRDHEKRMRGVVQEVRGGAQRRDRPGCIGMSNFCDRVRLLIFNPTRQRAPRRTRDSS